MEVLVYVEPGAQVETAAEFVARACEVARSLELKQLPNGAVLPDESHVESGVLTSATCART